MYIYICMHIITHMCIYISDGIDPVRDETVPGVVVFSEGDRLASVAVIVAIVTVIITNFVEQETWCLCV